MQHSPESHGLGLGYRQWDDHLDRAGGTQSGADLASTGYGSLSSSAQLAALFPARGPSHSKLNSNIHPFLENSS
ncbi:hypothetical protein P7K49_017229 [Saguinus oedipus]|uniref:Uncharacterized protein n=1 Tax=Saguinus oedipus TaxID=9490 RepID=A0ABQ9V3T3_SAGOE|nr:hypothetical protein P7K49_017229 [Saguinus oedipus]